MRDATSSPGRRPDAPDLLAKLDATRQAVEQLSTLPSPPFRTVIDAVLSPAEVIIEGRRTIMVGSNNYLGLSAEPALIRASREAAEEYGVGTTGSRLANGSFAIHEALESEIADFMGRRHAVIFTTGHQTNLGVIGTLAGPGDHVLIDADSHASIYDACRLSGAETIRFRHSNPVDLRRRLERIGGAGRNKLIIIEGCYSVRGDIPPLAEIVEVKREHGAYLLIDEAHSFGVFGEKGRGIAEHAGLEADVDFVTATFSKALASTGGFCASDHDALPLLRYCSRAYMFTASATPSSVASARAALDAVRERPDLRERLWAAAGRMREGLSSMGYTVASSDSPIVTLLIGEQSSAVAFWEALLREGLYCNLFVPPATPRNACLVRTSYTPAHTGEILERALGIFARVGRDVGVLG